MQQTGALRRRHIDAQLRRHKSGDVGYLDGVVQHVLAIAGTVSHAAKKADEFGVETVYICLEHGALALGLDGRCDLAGLPIHLRTQVGNCQPVLAAAVCHLPGQGVTGTHDSLVEVTLPQSNLLAQLPDVALQFIAQITDAVADIGQAIVDPAKLLAEEDFLLCRCRGVMAVVTLVVAPAAPEHHKEQEQNHHQQQTTAAEGSVAVAHDGLEIRQTIVHKFLLSKSFYK